MLKTRCYERGVDRGDALLEDALIRIADDVAVSLVSTHTDLHQALGNGSIHHHTRNARHFRSGAIMFHALFLYGLPKQAQPTAELFVLSLLYDERHRLQVERQ